MTVEELLSRDDVPAGIRDALRQHLRGEEAQRARERELLTLVENASDMIVRFDRDLRHVYCNAAVERTFGVPRHAIIGKRPLELAGSSEGHAFVEQALRRALETGAEHEVEQSLPTPEGTRHFLTRIVPERDAQGEIDSLLALTRDITARKRVEERAEMLKRSIDMNSDGAYWLDTDNRFVYANRVACSALGYGLEQLLGMTVFDVNPNATPEKMRQVWERLRRDGVFRTESTHRRKDGSEFPVEIVTTLVHFSDREYACGFARDITDRRLAEDRRRASEQLFRALIEHSHDAVTMIAADGTILFDSPSIASVLGYAPTERLGHKVFEYVQPEERQAMELGFARFVLQPGAVASSHLRFVHRDGSARWIEGVRTNLLDDPVIKAVVVNFRDVSERKRAEEAVRQSEERLSALIDSASDVICLFDSELRVVEINRRGLEIAGKEKAEIIGRSMTEVMPNVVASGRYERHKEVIRTGVPFVVEDSLPHPVFGDMHFILKSFRVGSGLGVIAVDLTERKRAEDERRRLEAQVLHAQKLESLGVLAGGIAHDFNNLLVSVLGNASLASLALPAGSLVRQQAADIETAARRASELCNQLLAYSGRGTFVVEVIDLNGLVQEMASLIQVSISKKAELRLSLAPGRLAVRADATQLRQIVLNLVVNASEALADRPGTITIVTAAQAAGAPDGSLPPGRYACLEVSDTGVGMNAETRRRLFDPFFTTKATGRGLGLSAALGIARAHQGTITVDSAPGQGTTFRVLLPIAPPADRAAARGRLAKATAWSGVGTVLIVDDEPSVRAVGAAMLQHLGFTPLKAPDGQAGLDLFEAHADEIRAVMLDLTMPHLGGEEALREIRARRPDVPVILMSGYDECGTVAHLTGVGFLHKPFDVAALTAALRGALDKPGPGS